MASDLATEKASSTPGFRHTALGVENATDDGYFVNAKDLGDEDSNLKTADDGCTVLIPQPTDSSDDPLNWSSRKKHTVLFVVAVLAFLPDFGSSMGAVTLIPQAAQWHLSENTVQRNLVGNLFCLGAGGIFTVALSEYFGRLPVLLFWQLLALGTSVWCAAAKSFDSFLAARILNGFFAIAAQAGGLMWIKDMFFFHEHARKINIWSGAIILSPYLGPFTSAFVVWKISWRWCYWIYSILNAVGLVLIVALADETYYNRNVPASRQPRWKSRPLRLVGIERHPRGTFFRSIVRPAVAVIKIPVILIVIYYFLNFAWIIGINATVSTWLTAFYGFGYKSLGLFYLAGIIGAVLGEVAGHWLHDMVASYYSKRHAGRFDPEARLIICYLAGILMAVGLLVLGFALQNHWPWPYLAVFGAMQVVGIMIATTAINAYLLDSYPEGSGEVGAWIVVGRTLGGFMATYIEIPWVTGSGAAKVLGIQCGITAAAMLIPLFLQLYGKRVRRWQGPMKFPDARREVDRD